MLSQIFQIIPPGYQYYALGAAIAIFAWASAYALVAPRPPPKFPAPQLYDETGPIDYVALDKTIREGFQNVSIMCCEARAALILPQYKGKFFTLKEAHGETVILPTQFMEELKALPDDMLNLDDEIDEVRLQARISTAVTNSHVAVPIRVQSFHNDVCGRQNLDCGEQRKERAH